MDFDIDKKCGCNYELEKMHSEYCLELELLTAEDNQDKEYEFNES